MAKSNNQKGKILYLERILQNSGEDHAVSMQEILETLAERGVTAERKSIYDDLAVLREFGMDIRYRRGKPGGYYLAGQRESLEENNGSGAQSAADPGDGTAPGRTAVAGIERGAVPETEVKPEQEDMPEAALHPDTEFSLAQDGSGTGTQTPSWLGQSEGCRSVKLVCENSVRSRVEETIGEFGLYKEKGMTMFTVTAEISETPEFYGWLTSLGRNAYIQKPKKTAAAYRDYLKDLVRGYKGV